MTWQLSRHEEGQHWHHPDNSHHCAPGRCLNPNKINNIAWTALTATEDQSEASIQVMWSLWTNHRLDSADCHWLEPPSSVDLDRIAKIHEAVVSIILMALTLWTLGIDQHKRFEHSWRGFYDCQCVPLCQQGAGDLGNVPGMSQLFMISNYFRLTLREFRFQANIQFPAFYERPLTPETGLHS